MLSLQFCISVSCHLCEIALQVENFSLLFVSMAGKSFICRQSLIIKTAWKLMYVLVGHIFNLEIQSSFPPWCQKVARLLTDVDKILLIQFTLNYQHGTWNPTAKLRSYSMVVVAASNLGGQIFGRISKVLKATKYFSKCDFFPQTTVSLAFNYPLT